MQNLIACSTKLTWTPIMTNYVTRHISAQILPIENLYECNSNRKQFADAQIQRENLSVFNSQRKQFVDAQTQTESFPWQNQNVFNAQTQTFTSTSDCDVQLNSAMFRRGNRLKRRQSQRLRHSAILRAKMRERSKNLCVALTRKKWCSVSSTVARCFWDDVMTFATIRTYTLRY